VSLKVRFRKRIAAVLSTTGKLAHPGSFRRSPLHTLARWRKPE
jgi:hypothetical protein